MNLGQFCCYRLRCDKVKTRVAEAAGAAIGLSVRQQQHGPTTVTGGMSDLQHPTVLQESSINENVNNLSIVVRLIPVLWFHLTRRCRGRHNEVWSHQADIVM